MKRKNEPSPRRKKGPIPLVWMMLAASLVVVAAYLTWDTQPEPARQTSSAIGLLGPQVMFKHEGDLVFMDPNGNTRKSIAIEIADTESRRVIGMMYRDSLGNDEGMLFIFDQSEMRSFWMKNTRIPLDIIYVDDAYKIVTVVSDAVPYSERSLPSTAPARYVVEVNGGFAARYGIKEGDRIAFSRRNP